MRFKYILICFAGLCAAASCYREKPLSPPDNEEEMLRFEFPQGTASWDLTAVEIAEEFNVYPIYKNLKHSDLNRAWTGWVGDEMFGEDLNDEQARFSLDFLKEHVFGYLNKQLTNRVLPIYYYLVYDQHQIGEFWGFKYKVPYEDLFNGMDYWSVCLFYGDPLTEDDEIIETPATKEEFHMRRGQILKHILDKSLNAGNIKMPEAFHDGIDYQTEVTYGKANEDDENYYLRRGFPGIMQVFRLGFGRLESIKRINPQSNFKEYIHFALRYNKEDLDSLFPQEKYPLLRSKRQYVINYIKTEYGVDLEAMAEGPEIL